MPSSGTGYTQIFTFVYSDTGGWANLQDAYFIFNSTLNGFNACYVDYRVAGNWISLDGDNNNWGNAAYLGSGGTVQNSHCGVNATASWASVSGNNLTLNLAISFFSSFVGMKNTYMQAINNGGLTSQWLTAGAWTVGDPIVPSVLFSSPSSGFGSTGSFSFRYNDTGGWANLNNVQVLFNSTITGANGCYVGWNPGGWVVLMNDAGTNWVGSLTLGSSGSIQNSQCTIGGAGSSTSGFGNVLTLTFAMTFSQSFVGVQNIYMFAADAGSSTPWIDVGTWRGGGGTMTSTNLPSFRSCIGSSGTTLTCSLAPGSYTIPPPDPQNPQDPNLGTLTIGRSNFAITGAAGPGDTTLVRGGSLLSIMMGANPGVTIVTISNLTFDGNRYGFGVNGAGISCVGGNGPFGDLAIDSGGRFTVQWMDFINAPATALILGGPGSSVSFSNFGQGGSGIGPSGSFGSESATQSATRSTAVYVNGSNNGAGFNNISYAGTAGITLNGSGQSVYGNLLFNNRYEISDDHGGGQLTLTENSSNAEATGNVIDGNHWPAFPFPALATGCATPSTQQYNGGVEAYGFGHVFYNNEVENHTSSGMGFGGFHPTGRITISSANPYNSTDTPRYIEGNAAGGIIFLGPNESGGIYRTQGVTLDDVLVRNNAGYGVGLDGVDGNTVNGGSWVGFINNSCMSGNILNGAEADTTPVAWTTLPYPVPASYSIYRGGSCPDPGWASQIPVHSHIPGWSW